MHAGLRHTACLLAILLAWLLPGAALEGLTLEVCPDALPSLNSPCTATHDVVLLIDTSV